MTTLLKRATLMLISVKAIASSPHKMPMMTAGPMAAM